MAIKCYPEVIQALSVSEPYGMVETADNGRLSLDCRATRIEGSWDTS
jgi:hypothetical protein